MIIFDANLRTKNKSPLAPPAGLDESRHYTNRGEDCRSKDPSTSVEIPGSKTSIHAKVFGARLAAHVVFLRFK